MILEINLLYAGIICGVILLAGIFLSLYVRYRNKENIKNCETRLKNKSKRDLKKISNKLELAEAENKRLKEKINDALPLFSSPQWSPADNQQAISRVNHMRAKALEDLYQRGEPRRQIEIKWKDGLLDYPPLKNSKIEFKKVSWDGFCGVKKLTGPISLNKTQKSFERLTEVASKVYSSPVKAYKPSNQYEGEIYSFKSPLDSKSSEQLKKEFGFLLSWVDSEAWLAINGFSSRAKFEQYLQKKTKQEYRRKKIAHMIRNGVTYSPTGKYVDWDGERIPSQGEWNEIALENLELNLNKEGSEK